MQIFVCLCQGLFLWVGLVFFSHAAQATTPLYDLLDAGAMDTNIDPCQDFYKYACNGWEKSFTLPGDKSRYWRQANTLRDRFEEDLSALLSQYAKGDHSTPSRYARLLGSYYRTCMDESGNLKKAMPALKKNLSQLSKINTPKDLSQTLAKLKLEGVYALFELSNDQDLKNSSQVIAFLDRGGISLPEREYYLKTDEKSKEIRAKFRAHVSQTLQFLGDAPQTAEHLANFILEFETKLAEHSLSLENRRDLEKLNHPMSISELKALVPALDWDTYFKTLGIPVPKKFNVVEPEFFKFLNSQLSSFAKSDLEGYLKYFQVHREALYVGGKLRDEFFGFWRAFLHGQKELPPRWKFCTQEVSNGMSEALGQAYVNRIKDAQLIRNKTDQMIEEFRNAFAENLESLAWMDPLTRKNALKKLARVGKKLGWPAHWRDYSQLKISDRSFYENDRASTQFEERRNLAKIGKPVDRSEWQIGPWEPNAFYSPSNNELVLPLGELVPPVYDLKFADGPNYGSLGGSTIGHELTHGFDDEGKDMDENGNLVTWWSPESKKKFEEKSECFVKQTEAYVVDPSQPELRMRGKSTLGENLADNGGAKFGLMALKKMMKNHPPAPKFQGLDEIQQYFLGYAQGWCYKQTPQSLRDSVNSDLHPIAAYRVNGVLANQPEFAEAFNCKAGSPMAPKNRCAIW